MKDRLTEVLALAANLRERVRVFVPKMRAWNRVTEENTEAMAGLRYMLLEIAWPALQAVGDGEEIAFFAPEQKYAAITKWRAFLRTHEERPTIRFCEEGERAKILRFESEIEKELGSHDVADFYEEIEQILTVADDHGNLESTTAAVAAETQAFQRLRAALTEARATEARRTEEVAS